MPFQSCGVGCNALWLVSGDKVTLGSSGARDVFTKDRLLEAEAAQLKATIVSPNLAAPIHKGTNVLWRGSFQLAWNEACSLIGEDLHFTNEDPKVGILNQKAFTKADLEDASYVAIADFVRNNVHGRIQKAVQEKFHGIVKSRFVPRKDLALRPQDFVAYACLFKNLEFKLPFESIDQPLTFGGSEVASFGISDNKSAPVEMCSQILLLDYAGAHDFCYRTQKQSGG